jgi:hypothetical protein
MEKLFITFLLLFHYNLAQSQTISKQVIGTAGRTLTNSNLKVSFTAGESVVGLMTAGGNQLGNGYYPALNLQALNVNDIDLNLQIKIYPNPASESLFVTHPEYSKFHIEITDLHGKIIYSGVVEREIPLDISSYTAGIYLVTVENKESNNKNMYKIIKK